MSVNIPKRNMTKKEITKKEFSLDDYKKGLMGEGVSDRELIWYTLSQAMQEETGLPGFPRGYVSLARGHSNTGKSTALCEAVVSAQQIGDLPIIIDTENNIGKKRLEKMGFDWNAPHIYIDNEYLLEAFGLKQDKNRLEASIEDLAEAVKFFILEQKHGKLPYNILFAIDSIGTLDCIKTINALEKNTSDNNMWNAGAFEKSFKYLLNSTIPNSRKSNSEFVNTMIGVQKIWIDNMGNGVVKHKGGETFYYGSRLIYHFGGIVSHGASVVKAVSDKKEVAYGVEAKVSVAKNQIDSDLGGISLQGSVISTPHGFIAKEAINDYKKEHIKYFRSILGENVDIEDIKDKFEAIKGDSETESGYDEYVGS